jgi:hypothetical protein
MYNNNNNNNNVNNNSIVLYGIEGLLWKQSSRKVEKKESGKCLQNWQQHAHKFCVCMSLLAIEIKGSVFL